MEWHSSASSGAKLALQPLKLHRVGGGGWKKKVSQPLGDTVG